nr:hypothetical protein I308_02500 [Cryptococcus tetragattii IND107]
MANDSALQASLMLRDALSKLVNFVSTNFASINQTIRGFDDRVSQGLVSAARFIANALNEGGREIQGLAEGRRAGPIVGDGEVESALRRRQC